MAPEDIAKTAVITLFGIFEYLRMHFGLCTSAQAFPNNDDLCCTNIEHLFSLLIGDGVLGKVNFEMVSFHYRFNVR